MGPHGPLWKVENLRFERKAQPFLGPWWWWSSLIPFSSFAKCSPWHYPNLGRIVPIIQTWETEFLKSSGIIELGVVGLGPRPLLLWFMVQLCLPTQGASEISPTKHCMRHNAEAFRMGFVNGGHPQLLPSTHSTLRHCYRTLISLGVMIGPSLTELNQSCSPVSLQRGGGTHDPIPANEIEREIYQLWFLGRFCFPDKRGETLLSPSVLCLPVPLSSASLVTWDLGTTTSPPAVIWPLHQNMEDEKEADRAQVSGGSTEKLK